MFFVKKKEEQASSFLSSLVSSRVFVFGVGSLVGFFGATLGAIRATALGTESNSALDRSSSASISPTISCNVAVGKGHVIHMIWVGWDFLIQNDCHGRKNSQYDIKDVVLNYLCL